MTTPKKSMPAHRPAKAAMPPKTGVQLAQQTAKRIKDYVSLYRIVRRFEDEVAPYYFLKSTSLSEEQRQTVADWKDAASRLSAMQDDLSAKDPDALAWAKVEAVAKHA